ncbi:hypothetical protein MBLNU230_g4970t1 [Neophaeotheca triangularis]
MDKLTHEDLTICVACGTQFDQTLGSAEQPANCKICDDPRQYVPPQGQTWTALRRMRDTYTNTIEQVPEETNMYSITTTPKFGIGQRCILLSTPHGNVLWDCITYLDAETEQFIKGKGGLKAIVISHPHYYTTHLDWAAVFGCPVWLAAEDGEWCSREDSQGSRRWIEEGKGVQEIVDGVKAIKIGGHFPGSLVMWWQGRLLIADSFITVPSALYHVNRPPGTTSYAFMWSIPNMIPLPPSELHKMWQALRPFEFSSTHGAFTSHEVRDEGVKGRVLESMKIQVRGEGWSEHALLEESWP